MKGTATSTLSFVGLMIELEAQLKKLYSGSVADMALESVQRDSETREQSIELYINLAATKVRERKRTPRRSSKGSNSQALRIGSVGRILIFFR